MPHFLYPVPLRPTGSDGYHKAHLQDLGQVLQAWMISQIPGGSECLDQLVCDGQGPCGVLQWKPRTAVSLLVFAALTVYARALGISLAQTTYNTGEIQLNGSPSKSCWGYTVSCSLEC